MGAFLERCPHAIQQFVKDYKAGRTSPHLQRIREHLEELDTRRRRARFAQGGSYFAGNGLSSVLEDLHRSGPAYVSWVGVCEDRRATV